MSIEAQQDHQAIKRSLEDRLLDERAALRSSTEACLTALSMAESPARWNDPLAEATKPLRDLHRHHGPLASTGIR